MAGGSAHSPGQRRNADVSGSDWYAVAGDGDSALRITPGLTLGELPGGTLALNGANPVHRWVRFDLPPGGEPGLDAVILSGAREATGALRGRHRLGAGAALKLPNNTIYISHDIRVPLPDGRVLELNPAEARTSASAPRRQAQPEGPDDSPSRKAAETVQQAHHAVRQPPTWPWAAAAAVIALTTLAWVVLERFPATTTLTGEPGSADSLDPAARLRTLTEPDPAPARQAPAPAAELRRVPPGRPETPVTGAAAATAEPATVEPAVSGSGGAGFTASEPAATPVRQSGSASANVGASDRAKDPALGRARVLLEAGAITYPPGDNAVAVLEAVLARDPENAEAMALMGECTTRMIDAAVGAHDRGLDFEARNTLEEVLGFNPNHERANRLWRQWVERNPEPGTGR